MSRNDPPEQLSVEEVLEILPGDKDNPAWVNGEITGRVISVEHKTPKGKEMWQCELGSDTSAARIEFTRFQRPNFARGALILIGGSGIRRTEYKGTQQLALGQNVTINVLQSAPASFGRTAQSQPKPPADDSRGGDHRGERQPPPGQQPLPGTDTAPPAGESRLSPVEGVTVGMAQNQACEFLRWAYEEATSDQRIAALRDPEFWQLGKDVCSVLIRLSNSLKTGHLSAPLTKPKPPAPPPEEAPPPPPPPPPAPSKPASASIEDEDVPF